MKSSVHIARSTLLLLFVVHSPQCVAVVITTTWQLAPPTEGNWNTAANWSSGLPTPEITAVIDNSGTADVTQNGAANNLILGSTTGAAGRLKQTAGQATVFANLYVGQRGSGQFDLAGGTMYVARDVRVAALPGSTGTITISSGNFLPGSLFLGRNGASSDSVAGGTASVVQTGGKAEVFYAIVELYGSNSSYELRGGTLLALDESVRGHGGSSRFLQSGGLNDAHTSSGGGYGSGLLRVGLEGPDPAYYELSGGELRTSSTIVGSYRGIGSFTQTGGLHHVYGNGWIGLQDMSQGDYDLRGGSLVVDQTLAIGGGIAGTLKIVGGSATIKANSLAVNGSGAMNFAITGTGISKAQIAANASFSGTLKIVDDGAAVGVYRLIETSGAFSFSPSTIELPGPNWRLRIEEHFLSVSKIPEPKAWVTCVILSLVGIVATRRHPARGQQR